MKIEIEFEEVELLKRKLSDSQKLARELKERLDVISESELKRKAIFLSYRLFDNYMRTVFNHLGFGDWEHGSTIVTDNLEHWLGEDWYSSDRINIQVGAKVTNKFKKAFISIGIIPTNKN